MTDKYILITGSSRGLGLSMAQELSNAGYNIILTARDKKNLKTAVKTLNKSLKHKIIKIDFNSDNLEKKLFKKIKDINVVSIIHNYGLNFENDDHPINIEKLESSIYNNFILSLKINNHMYNKLKGKPSKIIYIGSTASLHAKASPSYTLSKSLINTYVKNSSKFFLDHNIFICNILPGILDHKDSVWDKKRINENTKYEYVKKQQPLERFGLPEDITPYVVDIIKQKSLMMTGSTLKLDANYY